MSYLVLARKYRPQTFEQVVGQEHVTRTLQNAIRRGRIHHAFLFCGGRGTGKTTTARILAKALSCVNAPTPEPCNECPACVEITQGTSVDVQEIDAASQNRVEDIRDLREAIRYAPVRGKKKLYILDEVHMLSSSAFNALLKTLEEPPPHAVFVFATTDPHKLPQTILSRVQRYDFKLVPTNRLVDHLADVLTREGMEFERSALYIIAREGAGSVRDSLSLLDQVLASTEGKLTEAHAASVLGVADRGLILELGRAIVDREPARALFAVDQAYQRGFDLSQLSRTLLSHLRDLVVVSVVKDPLPLLDVSGGELEELQKQAESVRGRAELLFDRMVRVADETARATHGRYVLEVGLVELCAVEALQPVGELVDRLEQLEDRLAGKAPRPGGRSGGSAPSEGGSRPAARPAPSAPPARSTEPPTPRPSEPPRPAPAPPPQAPVAAAPVAAPPSPPPLAPTEPTAFAPPAAAATPVAAAPPAAATPPVADAPSIIAAPPVVAAPPIVAAPPVVVAPAAIAAPAPTPPPAAAPSPPPAKEAASPTSKSAITAAEVTEAIRAAVEKQPVMAYLRDARPTEISGDRLVLAFGTKFHLECATRDRADVLALLGERLGKRLQVDFVVETRAPADSGSDEASTLAAIEARREQTERTSRRKEAVEHWSRRLVSEVFGEVSFSEPEIEREVQRHV